MRTSQHSGAEPIRTCVGCRTRENWSALLRVVAGRDETGRLVLVPDPGHRLPGRGAWLHPDAECVDRAVRRKAFGRALRTQPAAPDAAPVVGWIEAHSAGVAQSTQTDGEGGSDADEHPMSTQR